MGIKIKKEMAPPSAGKPAPKPSFIKSASQAKVTLKSVLSPSEDFEGRDLFLAAEELKDRADLLMLDRASVLLQLAQRTCPYKVGDYLRLNRGLGVGGLVVEEIRACDFPAFNNRWAIQTCGVSKDGSVSRRTLLLTEWQLIANNAGLSVIEHKVSK